MASVALRCYLMVSGETGQLWTLGWWFAPDSGGGHPGKAGEEDVARAKGESSGTGSMPQLWLQGNWFPEGPGSRKQ
jgi:hypothetical protein